VKPLTCLLARQRATSWLLLASLLGLTAACSYTQLVPPAAVACAVVPPAASISYAKDVLPVLKAQCYRCHSATNYVRSAGSILNMEDFNQLKYYALPANGLRGVSYMVGSVERRTDLGFLIMPYDGAAISACDIAAIKNWVEAGSPNN